MALSNGRPVVVPGAAADAATKSTPGQRTWWNPAGLASIARGFGVPGAPTREAGSLVKPPGPDGLPINRRQVPLSQGSRDIGQQFGRVLTNPIGAGVLVRGRIKPTNSRPGQYLAGSIFWTAQDTPTSVKLTSLQDAKSLQAILGSNYVQAAVRTTG